MFVMAKYSLFFVFAVAAGLMFSSTMLSELSEYKTHYNGIYVCGGRSVIAHETLFEMNKFILAEVGSQEENETRAEVEMLNDKMGLMEQAFIFGSKEYSTRGVIHFDNKEQVDILYGNACKYLPTAEKIQNCTTFDDGLLTTGLHRALSHSNYGINRILHMKDHNNLTSTELFMLQDYVTLEEMIRVYLNDLVEVSVDLLVKSKIQIFFDLKSSIVLTNTLIGLGCGMFYVIYRATMKRTENVMKHNKSLPLVIPAEVASSIKSFTRYSLKVARRDVG